MGKYFGREPRYSRDELERQAQEAIDARVSLGRPAAEEWAPLEVRLAQLDRASATRQLPTMPVPEPMRIHEVHRPPAPATTSAPPAVPTPRNRRPVTAQRRAN